MQYKIQEESYFQNKNRKNRIRYSKTQQSSTIILLLAKPNKVITF